MHTFELEKKVEQALNALRKSKDVFKSRPHCIHFPSSSMPVISYLHQQASPKEILTSVKGSHLLVSKSMG